MAFGANQFQLPEEAEQLKLYFSLQIFALKIGSLFGRFFNPILKENVKCFGMNDCYPLAFGTPALAMTIGFLLFSCGKSFYVQKPLSGNMLVKVTKCMMVRNILKFISI
jgi:dipeptide/tripeptide permease